MTITSTIVSQINSDSYYFGQSFKKLQTFREKLAVIKDNPNILKTHICPINVLYKFDDHITLKQAFELGQAFKYIIGTIAICCDSSVRNNGPITIMDVMYENAISFSNNSLFLAVFEELGFKRAKECNPRKLMKVVCKHRHMEYFDKIFSYKKITGCKRAKEEEINTDMEDITKKLARM